MDAFSEQRLAQVMPALSAKIHELYDTLVKDGVEIRVVQGLRTVAEQDALYNQGRTTLGKVVTNCRGGYSWHNVGCAVDIVPSTHGPGQPYDPDWNNAHPTWKKLVAAAEALGLNCGADWRTFKDWPHVQMTGKYPVGAPTDEVRALLASGGLPTVWKAVIVA
jgi:peptidoglycan L-alanyl-D-glutamate endopeptidase CwlK